MKNYKVLDLFCSVGGFSYGFKLAGFDIILGVDIDKDSLLTFSKNINCTTLCTDVGLLNANEILKCTNSQKPDVIIGSPPCQEYSSSNQNKVGSTPKISKIKGKYAFQIQDFKLPLAYSFLKTVVSLKPTFFLLENVPPFFTTYDFIIINNLFKLFGYTTKHFDIEAEKYGIPQQRHRGFLIGNLLKNNFILSHDSNYRACPSLVDVIGDLEELSPTHNNDIYNPQVLTNKIFTNYQNLMHNIDLKIYNHISPCNVPKTIEKLKKTRCGEHYGKNRYHIRSHPDDISKVITRGFGSPGNDGESMHYKLDRCLTCREAARIQTFDDSFIFYGDCIPNIRLQIGNAVPPLLAKQFAESIKLILDNEKTVHPE